MNFIFTADALPEGYQGTAAQFLQKIAESLHAESDGDLPVGVLGSIRPTEDVGVFFNLQDLSVEYWSATKGRYVVASDVPIGTLLPIASKARGAEPPPFFLYADGSEVLKADYSDLYAEIGDNWGDPTDADHFRLPNPMGRVIVGSGQGSYNPVATQPEARAGSIEEFAIAEYFGHESVKQRNKPPGSPSGALKQVKLTDSGSTYTTVLQPAVAMLYIIRAK